MRQNGPSEEGKHRDLDEGEVSLTQCFVLFRIWSKNMKNQQNFLYRPRETTRPGCPASSDPLFSGFFVPRSVCESKALDL